MAAMDTAAGSNRWSVTSPPTSPPPNLRQRSNTGDRMRVKRSSSRVDGVSRHSDEDGAKTAVKVGMLSRTANIRYRVSQSLTRYPI